LNDQNSIRLPSLKRNRPNVDSLLHLFGNWLFEAAMVGYMDKTQFNDKDQGNPTIYILTRIIIKN
jgi:hypothetical protein